MDSNKSKRKSRIDYNENENEKGERLKEKKKAVGPQIKLLGRNIIHKLSTHFLTHPSLEVERHKREFPMLGN